MGLSDEIIGESKQDLPGYHTSASRDGLPPPSPFDGKSATDAENWLQDFILWSKIRQLSEQQKIQTFPYLLKDSARTWYETQTSTTCQNWDKLCDAFLSRYVELGPLKHTRVGQVFSFCHENGPVLDFLEKLKVEGHRCGFNEDLLISAAIKALKPEIRSFVLQQDVKDWESLCKMAFIAETSIKPTDTMLQQIAADLKSLQKQLDESNAINTVEPRQHTQQQCYAMQSPRSTRRVPNFVAGKSQNTQRISCMPGPRWRQPGQQAAAYQPHYDQNVGLQGVRHSASNLSRGSNRPDHHAGQNWCSRCTRHHPNQPCFARNMVCFFCSKLGHLQAACFAKQSF